MSFMWGFEAISGELLRRAAEDRQRGAAHDATEMKVDVPWGSFDLSGGWHPNANLELSADEQYRQNVANGHIKAGDER